LVRFIQKPYYKRTKENIFRFTKGDKMNTLISEVFLSNASEDVDAAKGRKVTITLRQSAPIVNIGIDHYEKGSYGNVASIKYPNAIGEVITAGADKSNFLVDETYANRFVHMGSAESLISKKIIDFFFDKVNMIMFAIDDINMFDKDVDMDSGIGFNINGIIIGSVSYGGESMKDTVGFGHRYGSETLSGGPADTKTQLLMMSGNSYSSAANVAYQINPDIGVDGGPVATAQIVSFGPSSDLFDELIPAYRYVPSTFGKPDFIGIGSRDLPDFSILINF
jgi:hypothetical protein